MKTLVSNLGAELEQEHHPGSELYRTVKDRLSRVFGESLDIECVLDTIADISTRLSTGDLVKRTTPRLAHRLDLLREGAAPAVEEAFRVLDSHIDTNGPAASNLLKFSTDYIRKVCADAQTPMASEQYRITLLQLKNIRAIDGMNAEVAFPTIAIRTGEPLLAPLVATTNYDLCFEAFCARYYAPYSNGFSHSGVEHEFDFNPDLFDNPRGIPLLKLHGSIDWWKTDANRVIESQYAAPGHLLRSGERITDVCIRYPVNDKQLFEYPYLELYSRLGRFLRKSQVWLFIGYSFGDPSIRNLVVDLARPEKKIIVVHPRSDQLLLSNLRLNERIPSYAIQAKFPHRLSMEGIQTAMTDHPLGRPSPGVRVVG